VALKPKTGLGHFVFEVAISHTHTHRSVPCTDRYLHNTKQIKEKKTHTISGIQTGSPSNRAAADPRPGPHGHWDRLRSQLQIVNHTAKGAFWHPTLQCGFPQYKCTIHYKESKSSVVVGKDQFSERDSYGGIRDTDPFFI